MESIVKEEINRSLRMVELCRFDSRLGFHSEAEGYKYFPEKLLWRIKQPENLLKDDFQRMKFYNVTKMSSIVINMNMKKQLRSGNI